MHPNDAVSPTTWYDHWTWCIKCTVKLRTCESFFSFESNLESNRPYTTQAVTVTQPSGLQAIGILYLWRTRVMYGLRNSEQSTCLFQFSHKTRQTMLSYAYFTPKVDFKCKFNHHQSFLYEWRLTARTILKFRIGPSIRLESRIGCTIRNRIESRSFTGPYVKHHITLPETVLSISGKHACVYSAVITNESRNLSDTNIDNTHCS